LDEVGTASHYALRGRAEAAKLVVEHEAFQSAFAAPVVVEMVRDILGVLWALLTDDLITKLDSEIAKTDGRVIRPGHDDERWFGGHGASLTASDLDKIVNLVYERGTADAHLASMFRESVQSLVDEVWDFLVASDRASEQVHGSVILPALARLEDLGRREVSRLLEDATLAVQKIQEQQQKAEASASAASAAAGTTGEVALSRHYESLAEDERTTAVAFRWLTSFLALVGGGITATFVLGPGVGVTWLAIGPTDYVHLIQRGLLVAGVLGLSGYFARQAHQHRSMANWAGSLAVQLKTFEAYLAPIADDDVKNELRRTFAGRVFGDHPAMKGDPAVAPSSATLDSAVDLLARFTAGGKSG
jgi:hypothetical protein